MLEKIKRKMGLDTLKEKGEMLYGAYMALSVKGVFVWDDRVQNTCDKILFLIWEGKLQEARDLAHNLHVYVQHKMSSDSRFKEKASEVKSKMKDAAREFAGLWRRGGAAAVEEKLREEYGGDSDGGVDGGDFD